VTSETLSPTTMLVAEIKDRVEAALESGELDSFSDDDCGQLLTSMIRLLAAKAQAGETPSLAVGNHTFSATDGVIACTAILETVGVEVFELSAWQALGNVGSRRNRVSKQG
jgi:hypothetical protein